MDKNGIMVSDSEQYRIEQNRIEQNRIKQNRIELTNLWVKNMLVRYIKEKQNVSKNIKT